MISMSEEKSLLFDVFMTRMRVKGNEFVSTSEFESDVQSAVSVIAEEVHTLRAQLAEANGIIQRLCLSIAYNKTSSKALIESQTAANEYLDSVKSA